MQQERPNNHYDSTAQYSRATMILERAKQRQAKKGKPQQVKYVQYLTDRI